MSQVYIVTAGDYSDYRIVAVFDNEQEAESFSRDHNEVRGIYNLSMVEPYPLRSTNPGFYRGFEQRIVIHGASEGSPTIAPGPMSWEGWHIGPVPIRPQVHVSVSFWKERKASPYKIDVSVLTVGPDEEAVTKAGHEKAMKIKAEWPIWVEHAKAEGRKTSGEDE